MGSMLMFVLVFILVSVLWMLVFSSSFYFEGVTLNDSFTSEPLSLSKQSLVLNW